MKQYLLSFSFLFAFALVVQAQDFSIEPTTIAVSNVMASDVEGVGYATLTNNLPVTKNVTWTYNVVEKTEGWDVAVCDINQCYLPTTTSASLSLGPNAASNIDVHAYPNSNEGAAVVEIVIADDANANNTTSALYYFNNEPSSTNNIGRQSIKVYPNPSNGLFSVKGFKQIGQVEVFSLTGRQVRSFNYGTGQWYDISDLPKGTYLVRLLDRSGQQLVTKVMNKL